MSSMSWRLAYEAAALRSSRWILWLAGGVLAVTMAMTVVVGLSIEAYYDFDMPLRWAAVLTQGGVVGWPPLFAFFLALLGVLVWRPDAGGESAYVAFATFPDRWPTALVRSLILTIVSAVASLLVVVLAAAIGTVFFGLTSIPGELVAAKALWVVVCGVTFAHLGAVLCVVSRSALVATGLLLVLPWVLEPVLIELANLAPGLSWLGPWLRFLPFRVAGDVLGSPELEAAGWSTGGQLAPVAAALTAVAYAVVALLVTQWRYCRADAT